MLAPLWQDGELGLIDEAIEMARMSGPHPFHQATGMFSPTARRVVAEDALTVAYRLGHIEITTGHLLLAVLDSQDRTTLAMTRPHTQRLARTVTRGLPGAEHAADDGGGLAWIQFDRLIRDLTVGFRSILPAGWTIRGTARSDIHLQVPDSRSESDFQIRPGWITAEPGPAPDRVRRVTHWMLERLQSAVMQATGAPWPDTGDGNPAKVYVELIEDRYNPMLHLGYGHPLAPAAAPLKHDMHLNMMISTS